MPLSEHEQRMLEQIEQALYAEDPKFAAAVRSTDLRTVARRRIRLAAILFVIGLGALVAGAVYPKLIAGVPVLGVLGFCVMLAAAVYGWSQYKRVGGRREPRAGGAGRSAARRPKQPHTSILQRLEERFRRRFDDRG